MVNTNLKYAFRQLQKQKVFSFINIIGLAMSMLACLLIFNYVSFERSFDEFHTDIDRLYRIFRVGEGESWDDGMASVFPGMTPVIRDRIPEVESISRLIPYDKIFSSFALTHYLQDGTDKTFNLSQGFYVDNAFLNIYTLDWTEGDGVDALSAPDQLVISKSFAERFFGTNTALGKVLNLKNVGLEFTISGVFNDVPENSHMHFDVLLPMSSLPQEWELDQRFDWGNFYTYLKLKEGTNAADVQDKINESLVGVEGAWFAEEGLRFGLQPVSGIHLDSHHTFELEANGSRTTINFLSIIGVFIMLVAWVNYINLSSAKLLDRAKEAGIRKVLGSFKSQLIVQFLTETLLINLMALVLSLTLLQAFNGYFETLLGITVNPFGSNELQTTLIFVGLFTLGSVSFGLYPAILFSRQKVSVVLKGKSKSTRSGLQLRRVLTVFQYGIAVVLLVGTLVVQKQLNFMQNQSLGLKLDKRLVIKKPFTEEQNREASRSRFANMVDQIPGVTRMAATTEIPGQEITRMRFIALGPGEEDKAEYCKDIAVDDQYFDLFDIEILHGRAFRADGSDNEGVILSLSTAQSLYDTDDPSQYVGKRIYYETEPYTLIGIAADVNQMSLRSNPKPTIYTNHDRVRYYTIELNAAAGAKEIEALESAFNASFPASHFDYFFLDSYFDRQYKADRLFGKIFKLFSVLAIIITSLGLFGLSLYNVSQRAKEVSVRKVLGARVGHMFLLLTKEYVVLLGIASVMSIPLGYLLSERWLDGFANRMNLSIPLFLLPIMVVLLLTLATVCYQVIKAIVSNPAETLRYE
ncbi:MAG: ABC transporter permease [Cytophagia bacterium]|nr:ABC transporter permease [Cytophagia bacterium]